MNFEFDWAMIKDASQREEINVTALHCFNVLSISPMEYQRQNLDINLQIERRFDLSLYCTHLSNNVCFDVGITLIIFAMPYKFFHSIT